MKKKPNKLLPGEIFYHPVKGKDPEAIWLVVKHEGRNRAFSPWSGIVLDIGLGSDVCVFDNVNFLDLDRTIRPSKVSFGKFIMANDDIIVKSILANRAFFSVGGAMVDEPEDGLYHMLELSLGMEGGNMRCLKDFGLSR
jgi:hypothetical protein